MLTTANWLTLMVALISVVMTVVLFLVGRLLSANKDAVDELRIALRDQSVNNQQAFRDIFSCLSKLRTQLGGANERIARLEGVHEASQEKEAHG